MANIYWRVCIFVRASNGQIKYRSNSFDKDYIWCTWCNFNAFQLDSGHWFYRLAVHLMLIFKLKWRRFLWFIHQYFLNLLSIICVDSVFFSLLVQRPVNVKSRPRLPIPDDEDDPYSIAGNNNCISNENSDSSGYSGSSNSNGKPNSQLKCFGRFGLIAFWLVIKKPKKKQK